MPLPKSLRDLELIPIDEDRPIENLSVQKEAVDKAEEQSGMDIRYQEELRRDLDRVEALKDGMNQACLLMFSTCCSKIIQGRLEALLEFKGSIRNNLLSCSRQSITAW